MHLILLIKFDNKKVEVNVACVASVSVKQRAKNGVFGVFPARKMGRGQKIERRGAMFR